MSDLSGRTYLVTGANTGIGRATAEQLAARGGRVVLACRSEEKANRAIVEIEHETGNSDLEFLALDLADLGSVRAAAASLLSTDRPLHVLINNAAVGPQGGLTKQGFESHFGVNHLGHFLLTTLLLDRLRHADDARVVNVTCNAHQSVRRIDWDVVRRRTRMQAWGFATTPRAPSGAGAVVPRVPFFEDHGLSKLCNVLFTKELARRVPADEVCAYAVHPGEVASELWRHVPRPLEPLVDVFLVSPEEAAQTSVYCATAPELAGISGGYYADCAEKMPSAVAMIPDLAAELWTRSEDWTDLDGSGSWDE